MATPVVTKKNETKIPKPAASSFRPSAFRGVIKSGRMCGSHRELVLVLAVEMKTRADDEELQARHAP